MEGLNQNRQIERFGIIMYDNSGHMSVQIVNSNRPAFPNGRSRATDKEKADAFDSYIAYYGTYTIEPENGCDSSSGRVDHSGPDWSGQHPLFGIPRETASF
jgi:Lipocalin-like domain